ncbi:MAG TPA: hypothetical protein DCF68_02295 [Cyanothece sp. UBA12306]|nr:hypothetical protein [Cyanothece sp. UBA12306]
MPPSSSNTYKSRLFNFLNRQSVELGDQIYRSARHLKLAAKWGIQLLIYPVYLAVQAGSTARKRLAKVTSSHDSSANLPSLENDKKVAAKNVLPPVGWFWQTMEWVQTSSLAIKINLFGESSLIVNHQDVEVISIESFLKKEYLQDQNTDPFTIKMLILAAIDYFFYGTNVDQKIQENPQSNSNLPPGNVLFKKIDDPWLSWDDLYQETSPNIQQISDPQFPPILTQTSASSPEPRKSRQKNVKPQLKNRNRNRNRNRSKTITKPQPITKKIEKTKHIQKSVTKVSLSYSLSEPQPQDNYQQISPDWIETKAQSTGYVKHPLVYVLELLDLIILWLEEWIIKFWNWLGKLFK